MTKLWMINKDTLKYDIPVFELDYVRKNMSERKLKKLEAFIVSYVIRNDDKSEFPKCLVLAKDHPSAVAKFRYIHPDVPRFEIQPYEEEVIK